MGRIIKPIITPYLFLLEKFVRINQGLISEYEQRDFSEAKEDSVL